MRVFERFGLIHLRTEIQCRDGQQRTDDKWNAPYPFAHLFGREQKFLHDELNTQCDELSADERYVLKARVKSAPAGVRHFTEISGGSAIFTAYTQALQQTCEQ